MERIDPELARIRASRPYRAALWGFRTGVVAWIVLGLGALGAALGAPRAGVIPVLFVGVALHVGAWLTLMAVLVPVNRLTLKYTGFRGNKVGGPDRGAAFDLLRAFLVDFPRLRRRGDQ